MENTLSRRDRERQLRREEMMHAARAVFAEKGYTEATLDEIAQRAEFGKGTIYNYFPGGKEDILFAIFDQLYDEFCRIINDALSEQKMVEHSVRDVFRDYIASSFHYFLEHQDVFLLVMKVGYGMIFSEDESKATYFRNQRDRLVECLKEPLRRAIQTGDIRPLDVEAMAHTIMGNVTGIMMYLTVDCPPSQDRPEHAPVLTVDEAADFIITVLFDGMLARSGEESDSPSARTNHETIPNV